MVVDDHNLVRSGISTMIAGVTGIKVIAQANCGEKAVSLAKEKNPDVILMDLKMPGIGGLEATRKLLRMLPDVKILIVTVCEDDLFPSRVLQAGAVGYLTKVSEPEEMIRAIRAVHSGQRYISPEIARQLALKHLDDSGKSPFESLSERELQVFMMITQGAKVQDIADKLCLSPKTVNSYRYRIFDKLDVRNDVELTHLAIRYGLLEIKEKEAISDDG
jgi:two-component system, NarL family, invasion response regulator UvrY